MSSQGRVLPSTAVWLVAGRILPPVLPSSLPGGVSLEFLPSIPSSSETSIGGRNVRAKLDGPAGYRRDYTEKYEKPSHKPPPEM